MICNVLGTTMFFGRVSSSFMRPRTGSLTVAAAHVSGTKQPPIGSMSPGKAIRICVMEGDS